MITYNFNKKHLLTFSFLVFAVFPLIPNNYKGFPVVLLILVSLINYKPHQINFKWFLINASYFILAAASLVYSQNIDYGFKKIETALSIIIIPGCFFILFPQNRIEKPIKQVFMKIFVASTTIFSIITLVVILLDTKTDYYKDFYSNKFRILVEELPLVGQHPIYASLFLGISLGFLIFLIKEKAFVSSYVNKIYILACVLVNLALVIMLSSRAVILSLLLLVFIFSIQLLVRSKNFVRIIQLLVFFFIAMLLLFNFNRRMNEILQFDTKSTVNTNFSDTYRINIYKCALKVVSKSILIGHGVGDEKDELIACYESESQILLKSGFNSHNQYLDIWIKTGLIGLISFLFFLFYNFHKAYFTSNKVLIYIILFYSINFLTENILVRQSGLIPFIFFIHFFKSNLNGDVSQIR